MSSHLPAPSPSDLLESLIHTTGHGAGFILRRFGRVLPGGVYFVNPDDPKVDFCFPREEHPRASDEELFALTEATLRRWAGRPETCAIALVTETIIEGRRVMKMQAETRVPGPDMPTRECVIRHFPMRRKLWWWVLGEAEAGEGLVAARFFGGAALQPAPAELPMEGPCFSRPQ